MKRRSQPEQPRPPSPARRRLLQAALLGSGLAGLRALATGLPLSFFLGGALEGEARAEAAESRQFLILFGDAAGAPLNANAPGSYGVQGVLNNPHAEMAPTALRLGTTATEAAAPWATLPQWVLDRTTFIHHRTYQNSHPQFAKVLGLVGAARSAEGDGADQLSSALSAEAADALGTIQQEPIALEPRALGESVRFQGRVLQAIRPTTLATMFGRTRESVVGLDALRTSTLDTLNQALRADGTPEQRRWLDRHALAREQVRHLDGQLVERFASIDNDLAQGQIDAAITLILMRVSPVVHINIPFGGDNHIDDDLKVERAQTITGVASLKYLFEQLKHHGLIDRVTVANLSVFGRTLARKGLRGRDHNLDHHVMMITGPRVSPSVVGALAPSGNDFGATGIDSVSGRGIDGVDIPATETLESAARTLAAAVGLPGDRIATRIDGGKTIQAALR